MRGIRNKQTTFDKFKEIGKTRAILDGKIDEIMTEDKISNHLEEWPTNIFLALIFLS